MSPTRKDPIPNQDTNTLVLQKYQCLPSHVPPFYSGIKSLRNEANDDNPDTTDTSRTDKYDTSHTNQDDSIENVKVTKKTNDDEKYKDDNSQHQDGNESVINPTKEEEAFIKRLMSINFKRHLIQYVIDIVTSCGESMIESEKEKKKYQENMNGKHLLLFH